MAPPPAPPAADLDLPAAVALLQRIESRLATLDARTAWLEPPGDAASPVDTRPAPPGAEQLPSVSRLPARLEGALKLLERLSEPASLEAMAQIRDLVQAVPHLVATAGDMFDEAAASAESRGVELDKLWPRLEQVAIGVAVALGAPGEAPPAPAGIFGLLRELRDPDVRRTLGLLLAFAKAFTAWTHDTSKS